MSSADFGGHQEKETKIANAERCEGSAEQAPRSIGWRNHLLVRKNWLGVAIRPRATNALAVVRSSRRSYHPSRSNIEVRGGRDTRGVPRLLRGSCPCSSPHSTLLAGPRFPAAA